MFTTFTEWVRKKWASPAARKFRRNKLALVGFVIVSIIVFCAVFADFVAPYDPIEKVGPKLAPPSRQFLLGTDVAGRDILSRIIYGTRMGLMIGLTVVGLWAVIGVPLGLIAGYYGGKIDYVVMRAADSFYAFPQLVFVLAISGLFRPGLDTIVIALGIIGWPLYARVVRGKVLEVKAEEYVEAARAFGERDRNIIVRHVFPNCLAPIIVVLTLGLPTAILVTSALSFLGFGVSPPTAEWGCDLSSARLYLADQWWWATSVGLAIVITVLGFNFLGDGLRDALDPRLRY